MKKEYQNYEPFTLGSQADQICYLPYPYVKRPRKFWHTVLKVNPRNRVQGLQNEGVILQQTVDDERMTNIVEKVIDNTRRSEQIEEDVADNEPEDEFLCNLSSSDEDEDDAEDAEDDDNEN